jgi:hypothetical protein
MQYVNGLDVASQCIEEILMVNEKIPLRKYYEEDGLCAYDNSAGNILSFLLINFNI